MACKACILHVVTYNEAAVRLYESLNFTLVKEFQDFYKLHGVPYGSYLYCYYFDS